MKLLAPVNSLKSAEAQIEAGADEIFVGISSNYYKNYSFSGRGQVNTKGEVIVSKGSELNDIIALSHKNNVTVSLAANTSMFSDYKLDDLENEYIKSIENAAQAGVDNVIIGDVGLLYKVASLNLPIHLHASTFFDTINIEQLKFLKSIGASRAILTYQISIDEIRSLVEANILEIEAFGYLSCSFYNGCCNLTHDMGETAEDRALIGTPCKCTYDINNEFIHRDNIPFFDADLACGLCSIKKLMNCGLDVIKIAGRERDYNYIKEITKTFRQAMDFAQEQDEQEYIDYIHNIVPSWWKRIYCEKNKCKYEKNEITESYIGRMK